MPAWPNLVTASVVTSYSLTNKYYAPGEQRAARVGDLFAAIAPRYDLINDLQSFGLHRHWKRRLIQLAAGQPGERALDLCCGTGDVAFALARDGVEVTGLDFSEPMRSPWPISASRPKTQNYRRALRRQRSISCAATPSKSRFRTPALRYRHHQLRVAQILADWEAGLREMRRCAAARRPRARAGLWQAGQHRVARNLLRLPEMVLPRISGPDFLRGRGYAYGYILESLKHYAAQTGVATKMRELQFDDVRIINLFGGVMSINYGRKP